MAVLQMRKEGLLVREVDGEVLVLDTESDRIHQLNVSASFIWHQLAAGAPVDEIAKGLAIEFNVDDDTAYRDVSAIVREFLALGFVTPTHDLTRENENDD